MISQQKWHEIQIDDPVSSTFESFHTLSQTSTSQESESNGSILYNFRWPSIFPNKLGHVQPYNMFKLHY